VLNGKIGFFFFNLDLSFERFDFFFGFVLFLLLRKKANVYLEKA